MNSGAMKNTLKPTTPQQAPAPQRGWAAWLVIAVALVFVVAAGGSTLAKHGVVDSGMVEPDASKVGIQADGSFVVEMRDMQFIPDTIDVTPGKPVVLRLVNRDDLAHDLKVNGVSSGRVLPGQTALLDVGVVEKDTTGWCTIAGHRSQGMELNLHLTTPMQNQSTQNHPVSPDPLPPSAVSPGVTQRSIIGWVISGNPFNQY